MGLANCNPPTALSQGQKRVSLAVPSRFLVRFPDGLYLLDYTDCGAGFTADRSRARVWHDKGRAEGTARLLGGEVCEIRPQTNPPAPKPTAVEFECARAIVEIAGARFCGLWPAIPGRSQALVLWNAPTGTTQGCLIGELSAELVRLKCAESVAAFEAGQVQP
jgi:hypothetical protein